MAVFPGIPILLQAMFPWVKRLVAGSRKNPHRALLDGAGVVLRRHHGGDDEVVPGRGHRLVPLTEGEFRVRVVFRGGSYAGRRNARAVSRRSLRRGEPDPAAGEERGDDA